METRLAGASSDVVISPERPTVLIGERINPTGKRRLAEALRKRDFEYIQHEATAQVEAGADILDINVGLTGLDEPDLMTRSVESILNVVDVPLCFDSNSPDVLRAGLALYPGKALINSVTAEPKSLESILPIVQEHRSAVIALCMDDRGIPQEPEPRLELAFKILEQSQAASIPKEDVIFDPIAMAVGAQRNAGSITLEAARLIRAQIGANQTLGLSNVSFGLPERDRITKAFLAMAIAAGVNCPVVDVAKVRQTVLAADFAMGLDEYGRRYLTDYRQRMRL